MFYSRHIKQPLIIVIINSANTREGYEMRISAQHWNIIRLQISKQLSTKQKQKEEEEETTNGGEDQLLLLTNHAEATR